MSLDLLLGIIWIEQVFEGAACHYFSDDAEIIYSKD